MNLSEEQWVELNGKLVPILKLEKIATEEIERCSCEYNDWKKYEDSPKQSENFLRFTNLRKLMNRLHRKLTLIMNLKWYAPTLSPPFKVKEEIVAYESIPSFFFEERDYSSIVEIPSFFFEETEDSLAGDGSDSTESVLVNGLISESVVSESIESWEEAADSDLIIPSFIYEENGDSKTGEGFQSKEVVKHEDPEKMKEMFGLYNKPVGKNLYTILFDYNRRLFDRGKNTEISSISSSKLNFPLILSCGYECELGFAHSIESLCDNSAEIFDDSKMFVKRLQLSIRDFVSKSDSKHRLLSENYSYACCCLTGGVIDRGKGFKCLFTPWYTNSVVWVLVDTGDGLILRDYTGNLVSEMDLRQICADVILLLDVSFVPLHAQHEYYGLLIEVCIKMLLQEDSSSLLALSAKLYGTGKKCFALPFEYSGMLYDRGKGFKFIRSCSCGLRYGSGVLVDIVTSVISCNGSFLMNIYGERSVHGLVLARGHQLKFLLEDFIVLILKSVKSRDSGHRHGEMLATIKTVLPFFQKMWEFIPFATGSWSVENGYVSAAILRCYRSGSLSTTTGFCGHFQYTPLSYISVWGVDTCDDVVLWKLHLLFSSATVIFYGKSLTSIVVGYGDVMWQIILHKYEYPLMFLFPALSIVRNQFYFSRTGLFLLFSWLSYAICGNLVIQEECAQLKFFVEWIFLFLEEGVNCIGNQLRFTVGFNLVHNATFTAAIGLYTPAMNTQYFPSWYKQIMGVYNHHFTGYLLFIVSHSCHRLLGDFLKWKFKLFSTGLWRMKIFGLVEVETLPLVVITGQIGILNVCTASPLITEVHVFFFLIVSSNVQFCSEVLVQLHRPSLLFDALNSASTGSLATTAVSRDASVSSFIILEDKDILQGSVRSCISTLRLAYLRWNFKLLYVKLRGARNVKLRLYESVVETQFLFTETHSTVVKMFESLDPRNSVLSFHKDPGRWMNQIPATCYTPVKMVSPQAMKHLCYCTQLLRRTQLRVVQVLLVQERLVGYLRWKYRHFFAQVGKELVAGPCSEVKLLGLIRVSTAVSFTGLDIYTRGSPSSQPVGTVHRPNFFMLCNVLQALTLILEDKDVVKRKGMSCTRPMRRVPISYYMPVLSTFMLVVVLSVIKGAYSTCNGTLAIYGWFNCKEELMM